MSCPPGFSRIGEFVVSADCIVPVVAGYIIDLATLFLLTVLLGIMAAVICGDEIKRRPLVNKILIYWVPVQLLLMAVRPTLSLMGLRGYQPIVGTVVHISAAAMACVPILFMYIELKIVVRSSLRRKRYSLVRARRVLGAMATLQSVLFAVGPALCYLTGISPHIAFWVPVIVVDFTAIPYFCWLAIAIYHRVRSHGSKDGDAISRKILVTVVVCSVLGLFTGISGIVAMAIAEIDWIAVRLCWIAASIFCEVIFLSLIGNRPVPPSPRVDS